MNIAKAFVQHESIHRHLPTGGWGVFWGGDPDRGFGRNQTGGWAYNILPYIEENSIHDIGKGMTYANKKNASEERVLTTIGIYKCPSRNRPGTFPFNHPYRNIASTKALLLAQIMQLTVAIMVGLLRMHLLTRAL